MSRTLQVILVIAIVCTFVEICALLVNYFEPPQFNNEQAISNMASRAEIRWKVYWFTGLPLSLLGLFALSKQNLVGSVVLISGVYLMLFGNNGGFWAEGYIFPRLFTSIITLSFLLYLIRNEKWVKE